MERVRLILKSQGGIKDGHNNIHDLSLGTSEQLCDK
jgi:hypothetical protein